MDQQLNSCWPAYMGQYVLVIKTQRLEVWLASVIENFIEWTIKQ